MNRCVLSRYNSKGLSYATDSSLLVAAIEPIPLTRLPWSSRNVGLHTFSVSSNVDSHTSFSATTVGASDPMDLIGWCPSTGD